MVFKIDLCEEGDVSSLMYYTYQRNNKVFDLENNPSFKPNIHYVFYVSMW